MGPITIHIIIDDTYSSSRLPTLRYSVLLLLEGIVIVKEKSVVVSHIVQCIDWLTARKKYSLTAPQPPEINNEHIIIYFMCQSCLKKKINACKPSVNIIINIIGHPPDQGEKLSRRLWWEHRTLTTRTKTLHVMGFNPVPQV